MFKECSCLHSWSDRQDFLSDPAATLVGYQVNFDHLELGMLLFNHLGCGTTLAFYAVDFIDLYKGRIYQQRKTGGDECPSYCLFENNLETCPNPCECAYIREVMQIIKAWPKKRT